MRAALVTLFVGAAGCGGCTFAASSGAGAARPGVLRVVAAENVWGSIAAQLGGRYVHVTSIVASPNTDPHDYEPTAADARAIADARLLIVNGVGYDAWASRLVAADGGDDRVVLDVGDVVGVAPGGNPHRWYSPPDVHHVARAIANAYARLDPRRTAAFRRLETRFETRALERYTQTLARIRRAYGGAPVGASESVFEPLAQALGLRLLTPRSFLNAISEGTEPTAADRSAIERQIAGRRIRLWVYNRQNTTPDVDRITQAARARGIPVASITETLVPQSASFQSWQVRQLESIARALGSGGAR